MVINRRVVGGCLGVLLLTAALQLRTAVKCHASSPVRGAAQGMVRRELAPRRCGTHKPSTTFTGSYMFSTVQMGGATGVALESGADECEQQCERDAKCRGWTYHAISARLGYCSRYAQLVEGEPNPKYTSGVCTTVVAPPVPVLGKDAQQQHDIDKVFAAMAYTGDAPAGVRHVAMIFDEARVGFAIGFLKSLLHFSRAEDGAADGGLVLHVVVPRSVVAQLETDANLVKARLHVYDYARCSEAVRRVKPFAPHIHDAPLCKLFLADILPTTVDTVLFVDNDAVALTAAHQCWPEWHGDELLGMVVDAGEACVEDPDRCWPMAYEWTVPKGLVCGTTARRAKRLKVQSPQRTQRCAMPGDTEPVQFNGGVVLQNLRKMRETGFADKLVNYTVATARMVGVNNGIAEWGDQDFLNNYLRFEPRALRVLPCGCNYQWTAARRSSKCAGAPVYIGHGWHDGTAQPTADPYNKLFFFFKDCRDCRKPPVTSKMQVSLRETGSPDASAVTATLTATRGCPHQKLACNENPRTERLFHHDTVYVLTRTAARPNFFREARASVMRQSHPRIKHIVLTDDPASMQYISADVVVQVPTKYLEFDAMEPCDRCGASPERGCGNAPYELAARERFLDCYCSTSYPMNTYMEALHDHVGDSGWIVYLDDDNLLLDEHGIATALAHTRSHNDLLMWKAKLGRIVPYAAHFGGADVVRGDIDSANFMYHASHKAASRWGNTRCGDYRTVSSLANLLHPRWINRTVVAANPMRQALGGLGLRGEFGAKITVIVTSCTNDGFRPAWLKRTTNAYLSDEFDSIVHRVILVWNAPDIEPPGDLVASDRLVILRMKVNSLNNRWTKVMEHVHTEAVLNLDDDVFVEKKGLICLINWWSLYPDRLVGPFVRKNDGYKYVIDELFGHTYFTFMLPRVMLLSRSHLMTYRMTQPAVRQYVDKQAAHCDDIVLNLAVAHKTKKAPFRVLLPEDSIVDYYSTCWKDFKQDTAGLGLQDRRADHRSVCLEWLMQRFPEDTMQTTSDVGACDFIGARLRPQESKTDQVSAWLAMTKNANVMLCSRGEQQ